MLLRLLRHLLICFTSLAEDKPLINSARQTALNIMRRVQHGAFAAPTLNTSLNTDNLSRQDRSLVTDLIYGSLRRQITIDKSLAPFLKQPENLPDDVRNALRLGSYEILFRQTPRPVAVNEWVEVVKSQTKDSKKLSGLVNAVLRKVVLSNDLSKAEFYGVPDWLYDDWVELFGKTTARDIAKGMLEPEPLWLLSYHPDAAQSLRDEGCEVQIGKLKDTLAIRPSKSLSELAAYKNGWVQPQNPSSTIPVRLLEPQANEIILDLASGNGIKAAQIAKAGAQAISVELSEKKLIQAEKNLQRLGLSAKSIQHDLRKILDLSPAPKVLLDAPCTGTGTLRGNPEIRLRLKQNDIVELVKLQRDILTIAAKLTAPNGRLIYAVCALSKTEGEDMMQWFLEKHPEFAFEPFELSVPTFTTALGSYILPLGGFDGFFISRFRRQC